MQSSTPSLFQAVLKRDGRREPFDRGKLQASIRNALSSAGVSHNPVDGKLADEAVALLGVQAGEGGIPTTQEIRDAIEAVLLKAQQQEAAQSYLLFRYLPKHAQKSEAQGQQKIGEHPSASSLFPYPSSVRKRDGTAVPFDKGKIAIAIHKAGMETGKIDLPTAKKIAEDVAQHLAQAYPQSTPSVEQVQDMVEIALMKAGFPETAKAYILYRSKRAELRKYQRNIPDHVKGKVEESRKYFKNSLAEFVYYVSYSRWIEEEGRRETWIETVDRFMDFMRENLGDKLSEEEYAMTRTAVLNQEVCPSMRLLWSAGPAARKSNVCAYNCSYIAPTKLQDFGEIMYVLMCGTGLGFSVEYENVEQLPQIKRQTGEKLLTYVVEDSKEGWADAFVKGMEVWFDGKDIAFDYSRIRPAGSRLRTMGGRASGPEPLRSLMEFAREKILARQGRRLRTIDVHDIICKIGEIVVAGGVRRSALISLSNLDDPLLRDAKQGQFYLTEPQRSMANNSAVYEAKPSSEEFLEEWMALVKSKAGERGIFNRGGLARQLPERRWKTFQNVKQPGTNPCGEIILRSKQFCNLSSIVVRPEDTVADMKRKMKIATLLGTYQATLTNFPYLSPEWRENCEEECLLGVSITGYYDNTSVREPRVLEELRAISIEANREYAKRFGINESTCITCIKPHGNSSQLLDTASGMHPRFAKYYIRRVRVSRTDPMFALAKDQGIPYHPEVGQTEEDAHTFVLEFPMKSPEGSIVRNEVSARNLLEQWKMIKTHFTEHNPSVTVYVGDDEWLDVAHFVYQHWDIVGGLSFLPRTDHVYQLAPYEEITKERYEQLVRSMKPIDFSRLYVFEHEDHTQGAKEYACVGGACEL